MQVFSCLEDESLLIGDDVTVRVLEISEDSVVLSIDHPNHMATSAEETVDAVDQPVDRREEIACRPR